MEDSWLNPDFAIDQIIILVVIFLASLAILSVVFGGLIYVALGLVVRLQDRWRRRQQPDEPEEES
ncbi:MAG: hypothetical protein CL610_02155 [Anaerolineaceae bacterium]|nr:hypothetical protein [Anaerolineaceae bacterium]